MPLIKSKSKKAFGQNMEAEMSAGKPQDQALAISYDVQRKARRKKMADGGKVGAPVGNKNAAGGVHEPIAVLRGKDTNKFNKGIQGASKEHMVRETAANPSKIVFKAEGGEVMAPRGPKITRIKHPSFAQSPTFKARYRDQEDDLEASMPPASPMEEPSEAYNEEEADKHGDEVASLHMKMMAEGGSVENEEDMQPEPEAEMEHHDSVAAAIMARRKMMAEGGQVDIEENAEEQPNSYYHQNEDAVLKENYDSDFQDESQPMESDEHGDSIDSDAHDMVSMIRRKIKMRMK